MTEQQTRLRYDDEGASAVEYGLLVAAIAGLVILLVFAIGGFVKGGFQKTCDAFNNSGAATTSTMSSSDCTSP